jgi:hypothetical protein
MKSALSTLVREPGPMDFDELCDLWGMEEHGEGLGLDEFITK